MRVVTLGGGSWGTALANLMANNQQQSVIYMRSESAVAELNNKHTNSKYLGDIPLNAQLTATTDAVAALKGADLVILAIPCQSLRNSLQELKSHFTKDLPVVCASKGIEISSLQTMSGVVNAELPQVNYAILSGPSFAAEVLKGTPSAVVLACADRILGEKLREAFSNNVFRVYSSSDVLGVEIGGALKNVMAIAAGTSDGLGFGFNARAALITRGLAEISRLGQALGANASTFMGLSGLGDLVLTCTGDLSRNRQVGLSLAKGMTVKEIIASMHMVAEGIKTTEAVIDLGKKLKVDLPIATTLQMALQGELSPVEAVKYLMTRSLKEE